MCNVNTIYISTIPLDNLRNYDFVNNIRYLLSITVITGSTFPFLSAHRLRANSYIFLAYHLFINFYKANNVTTLLVNYLCFVIISFPVEIAASV